MTTSKLFQTAVTAILFAGLSAGVRSQPSPPPRSFLQSLAPQLPIDMSSPVVAVTSFDPWLVQPGEKAVYRVTLNALETSIRWPDRIPLPAGVSARLTAQGQIFQTANNTLRPVTTFLYDVRTSRPGFFTMPAFAVEVYGKAVYIPEADLQVQDELPDSHEPARQLVLESNATNVFVGEPLALRVLSLGSKSDVVQGLTQMEIKGAGFLEDKNTVRRSITSIQRNGRALPAYIYETSVTPIAAGRQTISAQAFRAGNDFGGPITIQGNVTIPGGPQPFLLLDSEPITINVRPLPAEGRLAGFTGAMGIFHCDPPMLATNSVRVGDPVKLTVTIRGQGDLNRLVPPPPPRVKDWQVFPGAQAGIVAGEGATSPGAVFEYTLIPLSDESRTTPAIPFSSFDPATATYRDVTIPSVTVSVISSGLPTEYVLPEWADEAELEQKPVLSGLAQSPGRIAGSLVPLQLRAWFPAVLLSPTFIFLGLWLWDRRRRFLEQHPEIVRRNEARRQLRKQRRKLQRSAQAGDAQGFTQGAVTAMTIACAPHFPANPHALVCGDVLSVLDPNDRQGRMGGTVRNFFNAADNSRFATQPGKSADAFAWKSSLDEVLSQLEERL